MNSYHFNLGDSAAGPVGFCARVLANTKEEAVKRLRDAIDVVQEHSQSINVFDDVEDAPEDRPSDGLEYLRIYLNSAAVTVDSIDEVNDAHPYDLC